MSIMVSVAGVNLYTGRTTAEIALLTTTELAAMTVAEIYGLRNTHIVIDPSPDIRFQLEERSTATFEIYDAENHHVIEMGQEVIIRESSGLRLYGGLVDTCKHIPISPTEGTGFFWDVTCIDYQALADRRQFFKGYVSATADEIARDILYVLSEEGVYEGEIQVGPILENISFNGVSLAEAMQTLCERAGFTWFINEYKQFYFIERTTYPAVWDIVDGSEILLDPMPALTYGNPEYRNVQYLQSSNAQTSSLTQHFQGDGKNQTFTVGFPLAQEPTIYLNSVLQTVGIKGVDVSGYMWYWNESDPTITQDTTGTPIASTDDLEVIYIGYYKLITKATQAAEVTRQRLAQGFGTGKIEKTYKDVSLKSQDTALEAAKAKLLHYATVGILLEYDTLTPDLAVGTIQNVTLPIVGLPATDMLIYAMDITFPQAVCTWSVQVCQGPVTDSWQNLFCGIVQDMKRQASEQAGEADVVQGLEEFTKTWLSSDHPNPFIAETSTATPADVDFPCLAEDDKLSYCVLYSSGVEFFRKQITTQTIHAAEIDSICLILAAEANGQAISHVGLWGGDAASDVAGTGIELEKIAFSRAAKTSLESFQLDWSDLRGF